MARHNDKEFQEKLKLGIRANIERQFRNGVAQGMYAACKIIYDQATDDTKTAEERLQEIIKTCEPSIKAAAEKSADKAANAGD